MEISIKDGTNKMRGEDSLQTQGDHNKDSAILESGPGAEQRAKGFQDVAIKQRFTIMGCQSPVP